MAEPSRYRITNGAESAAEIEALMTEEQYGWLSELFGQLNTATTEQYAPIIEIHRLAWHPVHGTYAQDNPVLEHYASEHKKHPDPEGCPKCAATEAGSRPGESIEEQTKRLNDGPLRPCAFCQGLPDSTAGTSDGRRHTPDCSYHSFFGG